MGKAGFVSFTGSSVNVPALDLTVFIGSTSGLAAVLDLPAVDMFSEVNIYVEVPLADFIGELGESGHGPGDIV